MRNYERGTASSTPSEECSASGSKSSKATSVSDPQAPDLNPLLVACGSLWTSNTI